MRSPATPLLQAVLGLFAAALAVAAPAARASDSTPPVITHTPPKAVRGQPLRISAHITDESRIFPQVFFRFSASGSYEAPLDLKKVKGVKDEYDTTLPNKPGPVDYYLECYDEFGNGPARAGSPDQPLHVLPDDSPAKSEIPLPSTALAAAPDASLSPPSTPRPVAMVPAPPPASAPRPIATVPVQPPPAPMSTAVDLKLPPPQAQIVTTRLAEPPTPITAGGAALRSAVLPGWGQFRDERRIRGLAFGIATGASLAATLVLTVRAHQANTVYVNAPLSVRSQAYDQALDYARARNAMIGVTLGLYALNVAEAFIFHGTKDPW